MSSVEEEEKEEVSRAFVSSSALQVGVFKDVQELKREKKVNVPAYIEHNLNTNGPHFFKHLREDGKLGLEDEFSTKDVIRDEPGSQPQIYTSSRDHCTIILVHFVLS